MWEWSHTDEAYKNAEDNLYRLSLDNLRVIWAEWKTSLYMVDHDDDEEQGYDPFDLTVYEAFLWESGQGHDREALTSFIWSKANEQRLCTNGGHKAHMCPYGCDCHMVSFDPPIKADPPLEDDDFQSWADDPGY